MLWKNLQNFANNSRLVVCKTWFYLFLIYLDFKDAESDFTCTPSSPDRAVMCFFNRSYFDENLQSSSAEIYTKIALSATIIRSLSMCLWRDWNV